MLAIRETLVADNFRRLIVPLPASVSTGTRVVVKRPEEFVAGKPAMQEPNLVLDIIGAFAGEPEPTGGTRKTCFMGTVVGPTAHVSVNA